MTTVTDINDRLKYFDPVRSTRFKKEKRQEQATLGKVAPAPPRGGHAVRACLHSERFNFGMMGRIFQVLFCQVEKHADGVDGGVFLTHR